MKPLNEEDVWEQVDQQRGQSVNEMIRKIPEEMAKFIISEYINEKTKKNAD